MMSPGAYMINLLVCKIQCKYLQDSFPVYISLLRASSRLMSMIPPNSENIDTSVSVILYKA